VPLALGEEGGFSVGVRRNGKWVNALYQDTKAE
jgi:hypothetical protein